MPERAKKRIGPPERVDNSACHYFDVDERRALSYPFIPTDTKPVVVERAEGSRLYLDDGRSIIDAGGGAIVVNVGHGRTEVADAIAAATREATYVLPPWVTEERVALLEKLRSSWLPEALTQAVFVSGGSESVDSAIRLARSHHNALGRSDRWKVIGREVSYHGVTVTSLAAGGHAARRRGFEPLLQAFPKAPIDDAEGLAKVIEQEDPDTVAAFIAEPVIGSAAGAYVPPDSYWPAVREVCDRYDVLLIADEVMTGFGRTGEKFGVNHWNVVPDILVGGKGLAGGYAPMGAIFASREVVDPIAAAGDIFMFFTFAAHSGACAAANAVLDIIEREDLVTRCVEQGAKLRQRLSVLDDHPHVLEVRGLGLMLGIEIVADRETGDPFPADAGVAQAVAAEGMKRGAWLYPCGSGPMQDAILLGPPFVITDDEIDEVVDVLVRSLDAVTLRDST